MPINVIEQLKKEEQSIYNRIERLKDVLFSLEMIEREIASVDHSVGGDLFDPIGLSVNIEKRKQVVRSRIERLEEDHNEVDESLHILLEETENEI